MVLSVKSPTQKCAVYMFCLSSLVRGPSPEHSQWAEADGSQRCALDTPGLEFPPATNMQDVLASLSRQVIVQTGAGGFSRGGGHVFSFVPVNRPGECFPPGEAARCLPGGPTTYTHIGTQLPLLGPAQCACPSVLGLNPKEILPAFPKCIW